MLLSPPFSVDSVPKIVRGDYINVSGALDLTLSTIDNAIFTGTGFSGALRALEQSWGRDLNTMVPDVRYLAEPGGRARWSGASDAMLTRFIRNQLIVFAALTLAAMIALGWFYLRIPSQLGVGQYRLVAELPASGGLYRTSNVTYRGIQIGRVTKVEPTAHGVRATLSIDSRYKIPIDASANVHSVSAIGEQYVDLVSTGDPGKFFSPGQTITKGTVPSEIGPALDSAYRSLSVLPKHKIASLLDETSLAVGGLGPALQRLVDSTQSIVGDFEANLSDVDDIIANAAPIIDSQVDSGDSIAQWSRNLKVLTAQIADNDPPLQSILANAAPTADQVNSVFSDVRESLPQTIANLEVVGDMLKRYNKGLEQLLVFLPEVGSVAQTLIASAPGVSADESRPVAEQSAAVPDRLPAGIAVALTRGHQRGPAAGRNLLQDSARHPGQRRARRAQLSVRRRSRQAQGDAEGMPRQQALRAPGYQPLVRRPQPDP